MSTCLPVLSDYYSLSTNVKTTSTQNPEVRNATFVQNTNPQIIVSLGRKLHFSRIYLVDMPGWSMFLQTRAARLLVFNSISCSSVNLRDIVAFKRKFQRWARDNFRASRQRQRDNRPSRIRKSSKNVKVSVYRWSSRKAYSNNAITNNFVAWKQGHVVAAVDLGIQLHKFFYL